MISKLSSRCTAHRTDLVTTTSHGVRAVLFRKQLGSPLPNQKKLLADANLSGATIEYRQKLPPPLAHVPTVEGKSIRWSADD